MNFQAFLRSQSGFNQLLPSSIESLEKVHDASSTPEWAQKSLVELIENKEWVELNDRFFKNLAFGTGGIRGRSIGKKVTTFERGTPNALGCPEHAAVGSNMFNHTNVRRAAQGLGKYLLSLFTERPLKVVIAHDTRHFSRSFAEAVSDALSQMEIETRLFPEERSTPQLSFSVRWLNAQAGVVITASHNPPHDNGFKAYLDDGAQLVELHASGVITEVNKLLDHPSAPNSEKKAACEILDASADEAYIEAVSQLVLEREVVAKAASEFKIVYTPLHGTGARIIPSLLKKFGFHFSIVEAQAAPDGRFPAVSSPNPENAEALRLGIEQAKAENADLVLATDPDADRMGAAVRNSRGEFELLSGNQIGSLLAYYRCERFFAQRILNKTNGQRAALIKTFVTTDLQKKIAEHFGVKCVETLTGFKYIGEKLHDYEKSCGRPDYRKLPLDEQRRLQLERGTFFIFGGEESYGYSGGDYVRDKDANAAVLMLAELAAWTRYHGKSLLDYLEEIYQELGYFTEKLGTLTFEGAEGAKKIAKLLDSYRQQPPTEMSGNDVQEIQDFGLHDFQDIDGKPIPKEMMLIFHLANGSRMAVRGSGTEPKVKFYFFTQTLPGAHLSEAKKESVKYLDAWWEEVKADVEKRVSR